MTRSMPATPYRQLTAVKTAMLWSLFCLAALLLGSSLPSLTMAAEREFDRSGFGARNLPVWSQLTDFEYRTINDYADARDGDADALLALFVVASGNVRTEVEFEQIRQQFQTGLDQLQSSLATADSDRARGEQIHHGLHRIFYQPTTNDVLSAYDADQSQLTRIFSDGVFNCISSSLLYIATAHHFGLQTSGVLLPSHAYVKLELDSGEQIAIETTSVDGFDQNHDRAFYERNARWFIERDLQPPSYENHLQRRVVSAAELGLENMWNQHVDPERMAYQDRMRLAEIKGHLQPDDHEAQKNRMIYYTREFEHLERSGNLDTLQRLFSHIEDYMTAMEGMAQRTPASEDAVFQSLFAWLQAARANTWVHGDQPGRAAQLIRSELTRLNEFSGEIEELDSIINNLHVALARYAQRRTTSQAFPQAREAFSGMEAECADSVTCRDALTRVYAEWAAFYWSFQEYSDAIDLYEEYLALNLGSDNEPVIRSNMASAYINLAEKQWFDEDRETAIDTLQACVNRLDEPLCEQQLQAMRNAFGS